MNWRIEIKPTAEKQYLKLEKKTRTSVKSALKELVSHENPLFHKDVKPLTGQLKGDFRIRVGKWRILFTPDKTNKILHVYSILPRRDAY